MNTEGDNRRRGFLVFALEPPGNIAREISVYRKGFFSSLGTASARAFPDMAVLFVSATLVRDIESVSMRKKITAVAKKLATFMETRHPRFSGGGLVSIEGKLYIGLAGGLGKISRAAASICAAAGIASDSSQFLLPGAGFFVCRTGRTGNAPEGAYPPPPTFSFFDCSISAYKVIPGSDVFSAAVWRPVCRIVCRTGPGF